MACNHPYALNLRGGVWKTGPLITYVRMQHANACAKLRCDYEDIPIPGFPLLMNELSQIEFSRHLRLSAYQ